MLIRAPNRVIQTVPGSNDTNGFVRIVFCAEVIWLLDVYAFREACRTPHLYIDVLKWATAVRCDRSIGDWHRLPIEASSEGEVEHAEERWSKVGMRGDNAGILVDRKPRASEDHRYIDVCFVPALLARTQSMLS